MIIDKIPVAKINSYYHLKSDVSTKNNTASFGIKMAQPLDKDVVAFNARGKAVISPEISAALARKEARLLRDARLLEELKLIPDKTAPTKKELTGGERTWGVSRATAKQIREAILEPQKNIHDFMLRVFGDLRISELDPKNILLEIADRAKSEISIMEKSSTRKWNSKQEIFDNMTDLNGAKIVMNYKTGKKDVETALDRLIPLIKMKQVKLKEIELQRPSAIKNFSAKEQEEFDYVSKMFLDKLEDAQEEVLNGTQDSPDLIELVDRPLPKYTKGNYCALHLLLELSEKNARPFELQIMGAREAKGKYFDDKRFKYFDGKQIGSEYKPLTSLWKTLKLESNKDAKERFLQYCKDANLQLREDEIHEYKTQRLLNRSTGFFRPVLKYNLPPEYDLNRQYQLMRDCERKKAEKDKQALEAAKKAEPQREPILPRELFNKIMKKLDPKKSKKS